MFQNLGSREKKVHKKRLQMLMNIHEQEVWQIWNTHFAKLNPWLRSALSEADWNDINFNELLVKFTFDIAILYR